MGVAWLSQCNILSIYLHIWFLVTQKNSCISIYVVLNNMYIVTTVNELILDHNGIFKTGWQ